MAQRNVFKKPREGPGDEQGDTFGAREADGPFGTSSRPITTWSALSIARRQAERDSCAISALHERNSRRRKRGWQHRGEGAFAERAKRQTCQRDAKLNGGNDAVQIG